MLEVRLPAFNEFMQEQGFGAGFKMGIGLNCGPFMSGTSARSAGWTTRPIGDTINTASRIEGMTKENAVLGADRRVDGGGAAQPAVATSSSTTSSRSAGARRSSSSTRSTSRSRTRLPGRTARAGEAGRAEDGRARTGLAASTGTRLKRRWCQTEVCAPSPCSARRAGRPTRRASVADDRGLVALGRPPVLRLAGASGSPRARE